MSTRTPRTPDISLFPSLCKNYASVVNTIYHKAFHIVSHPLFLVIFLLTVTEYVGEVTEVTYSGLGFKRV